MEYGIVFSWWLAYAILLIGGATIARRVVPVEGRGGGLGLPLALAFLTMVVYWIGQVAFGPPALALALLALAGAAARSLRRGHDGLRDAVPVEALVVFTVAFLGYVIVRGAATGVVSTGEHFLDYGLLNVLLRAEDLPPEDVWFAGRAVNYYYGGQLTTALLSWIAGTGARYTYQPAIAGALAALVVAAYDVAAAVAAERGGSPRAAGVVGAFFVGVGGHLQAPLRLFAWALPDRAVSALGAVGLSAPVAATARPPARFDPTATVFIVDDAAVVFPFLEAANGYLHAHVLVTPLLALVVGLAFALYAQSPSRRRLATAFVLLPVVAGCVVLTSTWAFLTALGVVYLALVAAPADPPLPRPLADRFAADPGDPRRLVTGLLATAGVGLLALVVAAPFVVGTATRQGVAFVTPAMRSSLGALVLVHGAFLAIFSWFLLDRVPSWATRGRHVALAVAVATVALSLPGRWVVLALTVPLIAAAWAGRRADRVGFVAVLVTGGAGIVLLAEVVYVLTDGTGNRFNTLYKASMHVWVLWGIAAGVVLPALWRWDWRPSARGRTALRLVLLVLLVASSGTYAALTVDSAVAGQELTLDATAAAREAKPDLLAAVDWVDRNAEGTPTLVAAPGTRPHMYSWEANPASSLTGVPTLAGWAHEKQYRSPAAYRRRVELVRRIYEGSPTERARLLSEHDVRFVWVGPAERSRYDLRPFGELAGVELAYENSAVRMYAVSSEAVSAPSRGATDRQATPTD